MMPSERRTLAIQHIRQRGRSEIGDLAEALGVSRVTVHRILDELEEQGLVRKERGGVRIVEPLATNGRFDQRMAVNIDLKREIARKALSFVEEGDVIFIDASTTACCFAETLTRVMPQAQLTVVTNSPYVLLQLAEAPAYHVTSTGGELDHRLNALVGSITIDTIKKLHFNKAFISPHCVSLQGIMTPHSTTHAVFAQVLNTATETTMLAENPKFRRTSTQLIAPLSALRRIVTDSKLPEDTRRSYKQAGIEII